MAEEGDVFVTRLTGCESGWYVDSWARRSVAGRSSRPPSSRHSQSTGSAAAPTFRRRLAGCLLVVIVAVLSLSACQPPPKVVAIWGDSLTYDSWSMFTASLPPDLTLGDHGVYPGTTVERWAAAIEATTNTRIILALGTNDASRAGIEPWGRVLTALDSKCVVWPKTAEVQPAITTFDANMMVLLQSHPNVHVIDWDAALLANPQWLSDGVHYTTDGQTAYASMLHSAAEYCP